MQENKTESAGKENDINDSLVNQEVSAEEGKEIIEEVVLDPIQKVEAELAEMKDKYIRLYSEFENFRRRTSKEKMELVKTAGEDVMISVLPILDDFERALKAIGNEDSTKAIREGIELIYNKAVKTLQSKGLVKMEVVGKAFDSDLHEAITQIAVTDAKQKGKVVDEVESGYFLGEKVIRFAKVVIGA